MVGRGWLRVCVAGWLVGWSVLVCAFVCAFVSAFVCSFRGLFACVLSWVEIYLELNGGMEAFGAERLRLEALDEDDAQTQHEPEVIGVEDRADGLVLADL